MDKKTNKEKMNEWGVNGDPKKDVREHMKKTTPLPAQDYVRG